jgi:hypothetical protein
MYSMKLKLLYDIFISKYVCVLRLKKKLLRLYFKFDTYLIRHYDIIANISLYIIGVVVIIIEKIKQK